MSDKKKAAVIVGARCGLVDAIAGMLAARGVAAVLLCGARAEAGEGVYGYTDETSFFAAAEEILQKYGQPDLLVFCALPAVSAGRGGALPKTTADFWMRSKDGGMNLLYDASRAFLGGMAEAKRGRVLVIGTAAGVVPVMGQDAASAASAAAFMLVKSIALDLGGAGVTANALALGPIEAGLGVEPIPADEYLIKHIPCRRVCTTEEVLNAAAYLLLDAPEYMAGNVIMLDGAFSSAFMRDW